jgi:hypothetical protein
MRPITRRAFWRLAFKASADWAAEFTDHLGRAAFWLALLGLSLVPAITAGLHDGPWWLPGLVVIVFILFALSEGAYRTWAEVTANSAPRLRTPELSDEVLRITKVETAPGYIPPGEKRIGKSLAFRCFNETDAPLMGCQFRLLRLEYLRDTGDWKQPDDFKPGPLQWDNGREAAVLLPGAQRDCILATNAIWASLMSMGLHRSDALVYNPTVPNGTWRVAIDVEVDGYRVRHLTVCFMWDGMDATDDHPITFRFINESEIGATEAPSSTS